MALAPFAGAARPANENPPAVVDRDGCCYPSWALNRAVSPGKLAAPVQGILAPGVRESIPALYRMEASRERGYKQTMKLIGPGRAESTGAVLASASTRGTALAFGSF
jgi:hypothetical protein